MCGSLNEVKLLWCGEIMFENMCSFLFWRGSVDEEQKMDYLTAMSVDCLGGLLCYMKFWMTDCLGG